MLFNTEMVLCWVSLRLVLLSWTFPRPKIIEQCLSEVDVVQTVSFWAIFSPVCFFVHSHDLNQSFDTWPSLKLTTYPRCQKNPDGTGMVLCWVNSNLWSSQAPDFWPWECVQDSEPVSIWSVLTFDTGSAKKSGARPNQRLLATRKWIFRAYHDISTIGWIFFIKFL